MQHCQFCNEIASNWMQRFQLVCNQGLMDMTFLLPWLLYSDWLTECYRLDSIQLYCMSEILLTFLNFVDSRWLSEWSWFVPSQSLT